MTSYIKRYFGINYQKGLNMVKVYIYDSDIFRFVVLDTQETFDLYGDNMLEYTVDIPDELLKEYQEIENKFQLVQQKLKQFYK